jgi:glycosyltransferase involved in cell wall biosynthesis
MLFEHDWDDIDTEKLRMAYSSSIDDVGSASIGKVAHLFSLIFRTWWLLLRRRPRILYYPPASPGIVPVLRDIVYLGSVRWFFPKVIFHYHAGGLDEFVRQRFWLRWAARLVYGRVDASIEVNEWLEPTGIYFQAKKNVAVMNGVKAQAQMKSRNKYDRFQFLYVGMLCLEKGVDDIIDMMAALKSQGLEYGMKFVGGWVSDDYRDMMHAKVKDAGLEGVIEWAGVLQGDAKWQAYADADCFVFPTLHPTETFGLVLVEAMACGLPLITTRWRGVPTVVGGEEVDGCAFLCDVSSPDQYAAAAVKIMSDSSLCTKMGQASRNRYKNHFTEEQFLRRMREVFYSVLNR